MIIDGQRVGCCAFQPNMDFQEDIRDDEVNPSLKGSLYITTTGILPKLQRAGLGLILKSWQIAYAKRHGFRRIVTNNRRRNSAIIRLDKKFGFRVIRTTPEYYRSPTDSTVVMELRLKS